MATLTIRRLDDKTKAELRVRAAHHGRSMEEEARAILRSALGGPPPEEQKLAKAIHNRFARYGGLDLKVPRRSHQRPIPDFRE